MSTHTCTLIHTYTAYIMSYMLQFCVHVHTHTQEDRDKEAYYNADTLRTKQHVKYVNVQG